MVSEKFRHQLRREAQQWQSEGLIDPELYEQLAQRYQFAALEQVAQNRWVIIFIGLGSILMGLAAITFVAANWQVWSRWLKVALLLSLFVGVNALGFYLARQSRQGWQSRLGKGLLLLGALLLGANLALMSQLFHQSGPVSQLYLLWGLSVLPMAYSLRLTPLGILSVILTGMGYFGGLLDRGFWFGDTALTGFELIRQHLPLLASVSFIPLAYWCGSRWLFGLGSALALASVQANLLLYLDEFSGSSTLLAGAIAALTCTLPPALFWAYRDSLFNLPAERFSFVAIAQKLALLSLSLSLYLFSFHYLWESSAVSTGERTSWQAWSVLLDAVVLGSLAFWAWWQLGYAAGNRSRWQIDRLSLGIGATILLTAAGVWWQVSVSPLGAIATVMFNALLFLLALGLIRQALATGKRLGFWSGIALLVLQLLSRLLEYETGLLLKSLVLFLCGVGAIAAGLWFERHLRSLSDVSSIPVSRSSQNGEGKG
jgi:uncharacterized membrane protein